MQWFWPGNVRSKYNPRSDEIGFCLPSLWRIFRPQHRSLPGRGASGGPLLRFLDGGTRDDQETSTGRGGPVRGESPHRTRSPERGGPRDRWRGGPGWRPAARSRFLRLVSSQSGSGRASGHRRSPVVRSHARLASPDRGVYDRAGPVPTALPTW